MVNLNSYFSRLSPVHVAVLGDFMLDTYTIGKVLRKSPEAPVVIVSFEKEEQRAGGAGNAVLNLLSLGAKVTPIGRVGDDTSGDILREIMAKEGMSIEGLFIEKGYRTPIKNRIIGDSQQIVRIDHEIVVSISEQLEEQIIAALPQLLSNVQVIAISDYGKGFLSPTLLAAVIEYGKSQGITTIVDPKGTDFTKYRGATLVKPNESEIYAAANLPRQRPLHLAAEKLLKHVQLDAIMVTRSEAGISVFDARGNQSDYPVRIREVKDVTGAGDTVLAMLACGMGSGLMLHEIVPLCNVAAGIAIERFGCARITLSDIANRLLDFSSENKVFDPEHIFALQQALKEKNTVAISLNADEAFSSNSFQEMMKIKRENNQPLLVHVKGAKIDSELIAILRELKLVDFIFIGNMPFQELCHLLAISCL